LLGYGAGAAAAMLLGTSAANASYAFAAFRRRANPFTLGVASGDPQPDGVVLWTRLAPEPFAFASCQKWHSGFFTAYDHMAEEELDLVVHLGDYIYEYGTKRNVRGVDLPSVFDHEAYNLRLYRLRYTLYRRTWYSFTSTRYRVCCKHAC
jgi:phosphodiesterase/alkaline phosphatase D-like protein